MLSLLCICARDGVFALGFHRNIASWGELVAASKWVDCIMGYIYCTNTLGRPLRLCHADLHGDDGGGEKENSLNPKVETI